MMAILEPMSLERVITDALDKAILREAEKVITEAQAKLEQAVREKLAEIVMAVLSEFSIERHQQHIVITVRDRRSA